MFDRSNVVFSEYLRSDHERSDNLYQKSEEIRVRRLLTRASVSATVSQARFRRRGVAEPRLLGIVLKRGGETMSDMP
jgi:hypothetical protein